MDPTTLLRSEESMGFPHRNLCVTPPPMQNAGPRAAPLSAPAWISSSAPNPTLDELPPSFPAIPFVHPRQRAFSITKKNQSTFHEETLPVLLSERTRQFLNGTLATPPKTSGPQEITLEEYEEEESGYKSDSSDSVADTSFSIPQTVSKPFIKPRYEFKKEEQFVGNGVLPTGFSIFSPRPTPASRFFTPKVDHLAEAAKEKARTFGGTGFSKPEAPSSSPDGDDFAEFLSSAGARGGSGSGRRGRMKRRMALASVLFA